MTSQLFPQAGRQVSEHSLTIRENSQANQLAPDASGSIEQKQQTRNLIAP
jgi:hypothetical protein